MKDSMFGVAVELVSAVATHRSAMSTMRASHDAYMAQARLLQVRNDMDHQRYMEDLARSTAESVARMQAIGKQERAQLKLHIDHGNALIENYMFDNDLLHLFSGR